MLDSPPLRGLHDIAPSFLLATIERALVINHYMWHGGIRTPLLLLLLLMLDKSGLFAGNTVGLPVTEKKRGRFHSIQSINAGGPRRSDQFSSAQLSDDRLHCEWPSAGLPACLPPLDVVVVSYVRTNGQSLPNKLPTNDHCCAECTIEFRPGRCTLSGQIPASLTPHACQYFQ